MLNDLLKYRYLTPLKRFLEGIKVLNGSVSLFDILSLLVDKIVMFNVDQRATAVAFNFTLAVFPAILFLFTLIPYIPIARLDEQIMVFLRDFMPRGIYKEAESTIRNIVSLKQGGVLSFGFILALVAATNGMSALMTAFDIAHQAQESRGFLKTKGLAVLLTVLLSFVLFLAVVLLIVGGLITTFIEQRAWLNNDLVIVAFNLLRYLIVFASFVVAVSLIYHFGPNLKIKWPFFNVGALVASALIIVSTYGFSIYLSNFSSYNKLYGSIGTFIALMLWFYLIALLLIVGFELNVSVENAKQSIAKK